MTLLNICPHFKKCGICPFNPNAIKCDLVASSTVGNGDVNNDGCDGENDAGSGDECDNPPEFLLTK